MSLVAISGNASGTGTLTIAAPNTNSNYTLTLPQTTSTLGFDGPAFSAYSSTNQSITSSTFTKVQFNTEEFDTNSNYDNATNYRFTPTVAGYYQVNGNIRYDASTAPTRCILSVYKNGSEFKRGNDLGNNSTQALVSTLIYFNGSTDYIELYAFIGATTAVIGTSSQSLAYFQASMVRSA